MGRGNDAAADDTNDTGRVGPLVKLAGLLGLEGLLAWWWLRRQRCCQSGPVDWPDAPVWSADGMLSNTAAFNSFLDTERPCYRHYPESAAQAVLGMDPSGSRPQPGFRLAYHPGAGSGETSVVITRDVDGDDSVAAERFTLTFVDGAFTGGEAGVHQLLAGLREFRCQPGRGHQDWDTSPCL